MASVSAFFYVAVVRVWKDEKDVREKKAPLSPGLSGDSDHGDAYHDVCHRLLYDE